MVGVSLMHQEAIAMPPKWTTSPTRFAICAARIDAAVHQLLTHIRQLRRAEGLVEAGLARAAPTGCRGASASAWSPRARRCAWRPRWRALPQIDAALARGELSYAKVRAMTRVANADNEDLLLSQAKGLTGAELERVCAGFRKLGAGPVDEERRHVRRRTLHGRHGADRDAPPARRGRARLAGAVRDARRGAGRRD